MPRYTAVTDVMPLASMVTGAAVTSALCDQIRDNLVALYDGWWFRAVRLTNATLPSSAVTPIPMDTLTKSRSATDDGTISFTGNGAISLRKAGLWMLGFHFAFTSPFTGLCDVLVAATDAVPVYVCERLTDPNATTSYLAVSGIVNATTVPQTVIPNVYTVGTPTIGGTNPNPTFWGVWLGGNP